MLLNSSTAPNAGFHIAVRRLNQPRGHFRITALHTESGHLATTYCREQVIGEMIHELMRDLQNDEG